MILYVLSKARWIAPKMTIKISNISQWADPHAGVIQQGSINLPIGMFPKTSV